MTTVVLRDGGASDASTIADIHTRSWQSAYRGLGILSDAYLDGVANAEMQAKWRERMTTPVAGQCVWCADLDGETIGFLCALREDGTPWGALVDNLHLLVYEANTAAIGFYEALGGVPVSRDWLETADGGHAWVRTYHWREAELAGLMGLR